jgi:hypothetical protein
VLDAMIKWGSDHRTTMMGKTIEVLEPNGLGIS